MEPSDLSSSRGEAGELVNKHRPNISIPARNPEEAFQNSSDVTPSPMTIISNFLAEHEKNESFSQMLAGPLSPIASVTCMEKESSSPNRVNDEMSSSLPPPCASQSPLPLPLLSSSPQASPPLPPSGGLSVEERLPLLPPPAPGPPGTAFGHKPAASGSGRSNIARFKTMTPSRLPIPRSPCLTIPPGLSPTTLLDSPVLLSTGQAEPSPTTGTFPLPPISQGNGPGLSDISQRTPDEDHNSTFAFKPTPMINRNPPSPLSKMGPSQLQSQVQPEANPVSSTTSNFFLSQTLAQSASASFWNAQKAMAPLPVVTPLDIGSEVSAKSESPNQPAVLAQPLVIERPSEDGYNWRKYGQKQVKGSEFPRSYYKCTHPNCSVKKKVERSHDGQVTEIVYKGEHDHPKPQSTRRSSMAAIHREGLPTSHEDALRRANGTTQNSEPSLGSVSDVEGDGEGSKADDGDDDEPDSKRRKEVAGDAPSNVPLRTIREPRVVVQTMSEVDILDDGYRWRKYGQKVVKGNPHPRSYYKCTNLGCSVRKHVERSSTDPRAVITTYEGKHNHDVPAAKTSQHESTAGLHAAAPVVSHSNSMVPSINSALSLQDQYLMGKMREDRLKADVGIAEFDLVNTHVPSLPMFPVQVVSRSQGISDPLIPASVSYIGHVGMNGGSLGGPDNSGHPIMVRPKEEQDEGNLSSWPSMYVKSSSSSQGMSERLA